MCGISSGINDLDSLIDSLHAGRLTPKDKFYLIGGGEERLFNKRNIYYSIVSL